MTADSAVSASPTRAQQRTVCPFCRHGCELGVSLDYQYRIEYAGDAQVNGGRLCPRGNSASVVLDHPQRLAYPLLDGAEATWTRAIAELRGWLADARPEETAVVYSRGLTSEELVLVRGLAAGIGTPNIACGYVEPGSSFWHELAGVRRATSEDVAGSRTTLLVGDVFSTSPVGAGRILDSRYADRSHRLVVIDSVKTQQAGFAHQFLWVRPGTEPAALAALAALVGPPLAGVDPDRLAAICGVGRPQLDEAARMLKQAGPGLVGAAMSAGRVADPWLLGLSAQLLAVRTGKPFSAYAEAIVPPGKTGLSEVLRAAGEGRIKVLLWFGAMHPYSYPGLVPELQKVPRRAVTSIFKPAGPLPGLVLPVASELEKTAVGESMWGSVQRRPLAAPVSGTRLLSEILARLPGGAAGDSPRATSVRTEDVVAAAAKFAAPAVEGDLLLGEKRAIAIGGLYDAETLLAMSLADARRLGTRSGARVSVKTVSGQAEYEVRVTTTVAERTFLVGVNSHANRALFPLVTDARTGRTTLPPTRAEVGACQRG